MRRRSTRLLPMKPAAPVTMTRNFVSFNCYSFPRLARAHSILRRRSPSLSEGLLPIAILAGGLATRLRPATETIPKALLEVSGEPFVAHQLRLLRSAGARRVVLCIAYLGNLVRDFVGSGEQFHLDVAYSDDGPALRGTAGALLHAAPLLGESFLVLYGDSYLPCDYLAVQSAFLDSGKLALMTVFRNEGRWDTSNVEFRGGAIVAYDKKARTPAMNYIDYGLGAFHRAALDGLPTEGPLDLAELYGALLAKNQLAGFEVTQRFYEIGSRAGLEELSEYLARTAADKEPG